MEKTIERQGTKAEPYVRHYPPITGGVCEFHGVIDRNQPSHVQYRLCPDDGVHPKWGQLRCSYCDESKDPNDVIYHSTLNITDHPFDPNTLVVVCTSFTCNQKHQNRFKR